jgi:hypothetical protein
MNKKIIWGVVITVLIIVGVFWIGKNNNVPKTENNTTTLEIMVPENIPAYRAAMNEYIANGGANPANKWKFIKTTITSTTTDDIVRASAEAAARIIPSQASSLGEQIAYFKIVDPTAYVLLKMDIDGWAGVSFSIATIHPLIEKTLLQFSEIKNVKFGYAPGDKVEDSTSTKSSMTPPSDWKTYTNTKDGYSFQYPTKLSLITSGGEVRLVHTISFKNYDGGCDMVGNAELSETLDDFNIDFAIVASKVVPPYVDGTYNKGSIKGDWAYSGAEGCGQTVYYFPISGNRTLLVTKQELQVLSPVVSAEVRNKVLAVPGVISHEEANSIIEKILSTFTFIK